jgi:hypothetical protein
MIAVEFRLPPVWLHAGPCSTLAATINGQIVSFKEKLTGQQLLFVDFHAEKHVPERPPINDGASTTCRAAASVCRNVAFGALQAILHQKSVPPSIFNIAPLT